MTVVVFRDCCGWGAGRGNSRPDCSDPAADAPGQLAAPPVPPGAAGAAAGTKRTPVTLAPLAPDHTAWMSQPCSWSDMLDIHAVSAGWAGRRPAITGHRKVPGTQEHQGPAAAAESPCRPEGGLKSVTASGGALSSRESVNAEGKIMRVFVTGATGALGRHLVPGLVAAGHEVTATTRTPGKAAQLREAGAEPVVLDGLDREAVISAVRRRAGGDRARDDRAGEHAEPPQARQAVRRHERTPDPRHRQPADSRGAGGHPPGHRAKLRQRRTSVPAAR